MLDGFVPVAFISCQFGGEEFPSQPLIPQAWPDGNAIRAGRQLLARQYAWYFSSGSQAKIFMLSLAAV